MKCFYHPDVDAVGICKNCNKGLCSGCVADLAGGLACKGTCEEQVALLNNLLQKSQLVHQRATSSYARATLIYGLLAAVFLIFGVILERAGSVAGLFLIAGGVVFLLGAVLSYRSNRKVRLYEQEHAA